MSTQFRIGLPESRTSSRVLKPPGGGQSQIFGAPPEEGPKKVHQKTEISGCFGSNSPAPTAPAPIAKTEEKIDAPEKAHIENVTNGNGVQNVENGTNGSTPEKQTKAAVVEEQKNELNEAKSEGTPQRKRVPPGGFSSGAFW